MTDTMVLLHGLSDREGWVGGHDTGHGGGVSE